MVTPEKLADNGSELGHQTAFFAWLANPSTTSIEHLKTPKYPSFDLCFAIPNGGERNKIVAAQLKSSGAKAGVWDIFLPVQNYIWSVFPQYDSPTESRNGLWIEFKVKPNRLTMEQKEFQEKLAAKAKFEWFVAYTWVEAADKVLNYLGPIPR